MLTFNKVRTISLFIISFSILFSYTHMVQAKDHETKAEAAIVVDFETGKILYSKNADEALPPASMTKVMTEYIVLEKISEGVIDWDTTFQISDKVYNVSASNRFSGIGLRQGVDYTVEELYEAMAINSDNATTIALAELIAGSEEDFIQLMNEKAEELGLPDATFVNSTGLDNESLGEFKPKGSKDGDSNLISAYSMALLAYHLITNFPESLEVASTPTMTFEDEHIVNWNWMLPHDATYLKEFYYEGVDGLKTGNTELAGYNFTSTAERDGNRLITVVMNAESTEERFNETAKLLDYGFNQFEDVQLYTEGDPLEKNPTVPVAKGKETEVEIVLGDSITLPIKKGTEESYSLELNLDEGLLTEDDELIAPVKKGDVIGQATLVYEDSSTIPFITNKEEKIVIDVVANEEVAKKGWFSLSLSAIGNFFGNIVTKIKNLF